MSVLFPTPDWHPTSSSPTPPNPLTTSSSSALSEWCSAIRHSSTPESKAEASANTGSGQLIRIAAQAPPCRHPAPKGHLAPGSRRPAPGPSSPDRKGYGVLARAWRWRVPTTAVQAAGLGSNLPNLPNLPSLPNFLNFLNLLNFWRLRRSSDDAGSPTTSPTQGSSGEGARVAGYDDFRKSSTGFRTRDAFQDLTQRFPSVNRRGCTVVA